MGQVERFAALVIAVVVFTAAVILAVGAPSVGLLSGLIGAAVPVLLIYGVVEYGVRVEAT